MYGGKLDELARKCTQNGHMDKHEVWSNLSLSDWFSRRFAGVLPCESFYRSTVKFQNFRTPKNSAVIYIVPKIQTKSLNLCVFCQKDANGIANSEDPDQTAPLRAV